MLLLFLESMKKSLGYACFCLVFLSDCFLIPTMTSIISASRQFIIICAHLSNWVSSFFKGRSQKPLSVTFEILSCILAALTFLFPHFYFSRTELQGCSLLSVSMPNTQATNAKKKKVCTPIFGAILSFDFPAYMSPPDEVLDWTDSRGKSRCAFRLRSVYVVTISLSLQM